MKRCQKCGEVKDDEEFSKDRKKWCKECVAFWLVQYKLNYNLKTKYGLTRDAYNDLLKGQDNKCAICGTHKKELPRSLSVDHNHKTEKIRGLLCTRCNQGLGLFLDDPELLRKAAEYLESSEELSV
jgi:hypothetical protein